MNVLDLRLYHSIEYVWPKNRSLDLRLSCCFLPWTSGIKRLFMVDIMEESKILIFFKLKITPISHRNSVDLRPFFESGDAEIGGMVLSQLSKLWTKVYLALIWRCVPNVLILVNVESFLILWREILSSWIKMALL